MIARKAAVYIRVAHADDDALENQERLVIGFAKNKGFSDFAIYSDNGASGLTLKRPGMSKLMADIRNDAIGTVIMEDDTRIARDIHLLCGWIDFSKKHKVDVIPVFGRSLANSSYIPHFLRNCLRQNDFLIDVSPHKRVFCVKVHDSHSVTYDYFNGLLNYAGAV